MRMRKITESVLMSDKNLKDYDLNDISKLFYDSVGSVIIVDPSIDTYRAMVRRGIFETILDETGSYHDLIMKLWFHFGDTNEEVVEDYQVFASFSGDFNGKYSRRLKVGTDNEDKPHLAQLTVYPFEDNSKYIFILDELDDKESIEESLTTKKINTIQNSYLFSMYIDLAQDTTSSINITEISEDTVNVQLKYSEWRMMIVNMFLPEDQEQFLRRTDPEYLKKNFTPGRTSSYDCMMRNMEGKFIWVKLIFSRAQTYNDDDYRFVFMVQDIHDNSMEILSALKKYEEMAITDPLTGVFNHGEIETQFNNALSMKHKKGDPVSVMMLDLDHFKEVNDTYGHSVGDTTLKTFADIAKELAISEKALVGRWGGEEFVIICQDKGADNANVLARRLKQRVEDHEFPTIGHITCSIGVTEIKSDDTFEEAFNRIDKAMYESKNNGRNMITVL